MPGIVVGIDVSEFNKKLSAAQQAVNGLSSVLKVVPREAQSAGSALSDTGKNAQNAAGNIKSLAKQLLGLVGAYKAVDSAMNFAKRGVETNASWEQSKIGIASVIASVNQLEDAQGNLLKGPEAYQAALGLAEQAMNRIKIMGLETTATTDDLVAGFQQLIGPAAAAGLSMEQTLQFTTSMVQSLGAIGIPFNQLSAEARSLLDGTIVPTQDRLATTLGITGDMVRNWKEQGVLAEKLLEKMSAFAAAGDDVSRTWSGVKSNLQDAVDMVASVTSKGMYADLKESLLTIQRLLVDTSDTASGVSGDIEHIVRVMETIQNSIGQHLLTTTKVFVDQVKDINDFIGDKGEIAFFEDLADAVQIAVGAFTALYAVRSTTSGALRGMATGLASQVTAIKKSTVEAYNNARATRQQAIANREAAAAELAAAEAKLAKAKAEEASYASASKSIGITKQHESAFRRIVEAETAYQAAKARSVAAERAHAAAMTVTARAGRVMSVALAGMRGLLTLLGGPFGIALTAAAAGVTYLATRQSDAERAAENHAEALKLLDNALKDATDQSGNLTRALDDLEKKELQIGINKLSQALRSEMAALQSKVKDAVSDINWELMSIGRDTGETDLNLSDLRDTLEALPEMLKNGQISAEDFYDEMLNLALVARENNLDDLADKIEKLATAEKNSAKTINETTKALNKKKSLLKQSQEATNSAKIASNEYTQAIKNLEAAQEALNKSGQKEIKTAADAVEWLAKRYNATKQGKEALEAEAKATDEAALATLRLASAQALAEAMAAGLIASQEGATQAQIANAQKLFAEYSKLASFIAKVEGNKGNLGEKVGGGGTSSIDNARQSIERLKDEIAQLNGTAAKSGADLNKKIAEIDKLGKAAKLSAGETQKLKTEYTQAFKADTLKEFDKALLEAQGDTHALQQIKIDETMQTWGAQFSQLNTKLSELGLATIDTTPKLEEMRKALDHEQNTKNLQVTADFYKQLSEYSGDFNLSMEYQNRLIEIQGQNWIQNGIAMNDVIEMQKLMRQEAARDPWSGMLRGMRKWSGEATNLGKQVETSLTSAFDNASDALADFVTTGKLNFADLANSIISDLARIAARQAIGGIVGGLASGLGNLFGGSYTDTAKNMVNYIPGVNFSAKGNVFSGGNISDYSNSIVSRPTLFSYGSQLQPFARGAGLMGEAGPEAIVPLARTTSGKLGFHVDFEQRQLQRDMDRLKTSMNTVEAIILSHKAQREAAAAPAPEVKVNIINNSNAQVTQETRTDNYGNKTIDVMVGDAAARQLNRPGTTLNKSLYQQTGLQRRAIRR